MSEAKEWSLAEAVTAFMDEGFSDGDLVGHDWLRMTLDINASAVKQNEFVVLERMEAFKNALLFGHQIALQNIRGRGYRVVPPAEQARFAVTEAAREFRRSFYKCEARLVNTRHDELSDDEKRRHTDAQVRVAALSGMVNKGQRDVFQLFDARQKKAS